MNKENWDLEKIKIGLQKYFKQYGHYPTADEMDHSNYLPSSRQIQRKFGGLVNLRKKIGLTISDYTKGTSRTNKLYKINPRGYEQEKNLELHLIKNFGEYFVHVEKKIPNLSNLRLDFFIYTREANIAVDVFYPETINLLKRIINIKRNKYQKYSGAFYFVCANRDISQVLIDKYIKNKTNILPSNFHVLTLDNFDKEMNKYSRLEIQ